MIEALRFRRWEEAGGSCLDADALAAFVDGCLDDARRAVVVEHLAGCHECLAATTALLRLSEEETPQAHRIPVGRVLELSRKKPPAAAVWGRWQTVLPAAAAILLVLGALVLRQSWPTSGGGPLSGEETRQQRSLPASDSDAAPKIELPADGAVVDADRLELVWRASPSALFYEVEVLSEDGDIIWHARMEGTRTRLPAETRLRAGHYFVWVRAHLPDGKTSRSPAQTFEVATVP